jgi:hypothetical protein
MFLRGALCALLISAMGSFALATEKPSAGKAKATQQPKKPTLRLVQPGGARPRAVVAKPKAYVQMPGPDLVLEGPTDCKMYAGVSSWRFWCSFDVKNRGTRIAGTSLVKVEGTDVKDKTEKVPQLPAGTSWSFGVSISLSSKGIMRVDALNQVAESNENNNVYMIE